MNSLQKAQAILVELAALNVQDIILCPGGRNAPFVQLLSEPTPFRVKTFFDERAAGFFALGLCQVQERPVAIITTSGTAVAELLPAVIEAEYTQLPLIVVSADRPRKLRGTGAPQTIDQLSFLKGHVEAALDLETAEEFASPLLEDFSLRRPLHLNVCFEEPLVDKNFSALPLKLSRREAKPILTENGARVQKFLFAQRSTLLILSSLKRSEIPWVDEFLSRWTGAVYAESTSGLRERDHAGMLKSGDKILQQALKHQLFDSVLRIGGVPTARVWRDFEESQIPVLSVSSLPFPGMSRGELVHGEMSLLKNVEIPSHLSMASDLIDNDHKKSQQLLQLIEKYPQSEPALIEKISTQTSSEDIVYIGNSLPIREWDLAASRKNPHAVRANRGVNGIDGQISSALAYTHDGRSLTIVVGDLTALYDMNALWALTKQAAVKIYVINNQGGRIFERLFNMPLFYNHHQLEFSGWAKMWNIPYVQWPNSALPKEKTFIAEVVPSVQQTQSFWKEYGELWRD
ncbi:MAG: 2-succinyl-5-enolpyruvyl-6-hydroxy-3-cyclohexene-1-carboxylic-acid synthase [Bdellovibrionales bacterium]|nr:2-succinyl-5-enolpyruvyl-6-hydroxy-3-cyclohexene-1-carboxylic-acid synthase [Bdellovibrionales bacterium]